MRPYLLVFALLLVACSNVSERQSAALSRAVYGVERSIKAGRYDLAAKYAEQTVRLTPPPKKKPVVSPISFKGTRYVVLPVEQKDAPTLALGSPAMDALLNESNTLAGQMRAEDKAANSVEKEADKVLIKKEEILAKAETAEVVKRASLWGKVKSWGTLAGAVLSLGLLCFLFPAAIPLLVSIFNAIRGILGALMGVIRGALGAFFSKKGGE